jgi:hypothetical protein
VNAEADDEHEVAGVVTIEKWQRNKTTGLEKKAICTLGAALATYEQFDGGRES